MNKDPRNQEIAFRVLCGWETMSAVALDYGISRERVRQIVNRFDPDGWRPGKATLHGPDDHPLRPNMTPKEQGLYLRRLYRPRVRERRRRILAQIKGLADTLNRMPTMHEMQDSGIYNGTVQGVFSGVRCYKTAIRRVARLIGYTPRTPGVSVHNPHPKTHCKHGHEFTTENTYVYRARRQCRACHRLRLAKARKPRRKAA